MTMQAQVQTDPYAAFKTAYAGSRQEQVFGPLDQAKLNNNSFLEQLPNEIFRLLPSDRLSGFSTQRLQKLPNEDVIALVRQNPALVAGFPADYWKKFPGDFVQQEIIPHLQRTDQAGLASQVAQALQQQPQAQAIYRAQSATGATPGTGSSIFATRPSSLYGPTPLPPQTPPRAPGGEVGPGTEPTGSGPTGGGIPIGQPGNTPPAPPARQPQLGETRRGKDVYGNDTIETLTAGQYAGDPPYWKVSYPPRPPAGSTARPRDASQIAASNAAAAASQASADRQAADAARLAEMTPSEIAQNLAQVKLIEQQAIRMAALLPGEQGIQAATIAQINAGIQTAQGQLALARLNSDRQAEQAANDLLFRYQDLQQRAESGNADRQLRAELAYADSRRADVNTQLGISDRTGVYDGTTTLAGRAQNLAEARFQAEQRQNPSSILDRIYNSRGGVGPADANLPAQAPAPVPAPVAQAPAAPPQAQAPAPAPVPVPGPGQVPPSLLGPVSEAAGNLGAPVQNPISPIAAPVVGTGQPAQPSQNVSPKLAQQYAEWVAAKQAAGEDPSDLNEFRQHVIRMGEPDPGDLSGSFQPFSSQPQIPVQQLLQQQPQMGLRSTVAAAQPAATVNPVRSPLTGAPSAYSVQQPQMPRQTPQALDLTPPKPITYAELQNSDVLDKTFLRPAFENQAQPTFRAAGGVPMLSQQRLGNLTSDQNKVLDATLLASGTTPEDYRAQAAQYAQTGTANVGRLRLPRQQRVY